MIPELGQAFISFLLIAGAGIVAALISSYLKISQIVIFISIGFSISFLLPIHAFRWDFFLQLADFSLIYVFFMTLIEAELNARISGKFALAVVALATILVSTLPALLILKTIFGVSIIPVVVSILIFNLHAFRVHTFSNTFRKQPKFPSDIISYFSFISTLVTIIVLSLLVFRTERHQATGNLLQWIISILMIIIFASTILPVTLRYLMKKISEESYLNFYLSLFIFLFLVLIFHQFRLELFLAGILGGIILNQFIPESSVILQRLRFLGNSFLIPAFYLTLGHKFPLTELFSRYSILFSLLLISNLIISRLICYWVLNQSRLINLKRADLFGWLTPNPLILALAYIAYDNGLINIDTFAAVLIASVLLLLSQVIVPAPQIVQDAFQVRPTRVLLPVSNPENMISLLNFALNISSNHHLPRIYPLNIINDNENAEEKVAQIEEQFFELIDEYANRNLHLELTTRIDNDRARAIEKTARELMIDVILTGLGSVPTLEKPKGYSFLMALLQITPRPILAAHLIGDLRSTSSIRLFLASEKLASDAMPWLNIVIIMARRLKAGLTICGHEAILALLREQLDSIGSLPVIEYRPTQIHAGLDLLTSSENMESLSIAILERPKSRGDSRNLSHRLPEMMLRSFGDRNFVLFYPAAELSEKLPAKPSMSKSFVQYFKNLFSAKAR